jgi:hypothetical protein
VLPVNGDGSAGQPSADPVPTFTRARLAFRRWRRTRPFWGGLFLLLSGLEFYVSAHMDLLPVKMSFGEQGFLSWLIPLVVLLCGVLTWISPAQRAFYGIIGAVTALAGVIALNLGGFFVGMLLGLVGGALAVAWTPGATAPAPAPPEPPEERPDGSLDELLEGGRDGGGDAQTTDVLPTGPLTDQLPAAQKSPLGTPPIQGGGRHAANRQEPPRALLLALLAAAVTSALLALPRPPDALAAPCPPPPAPAPPPPAPSASASPSPSPTGGGGNAVGNFFDGLGRLLGLGPKQAADPPAPAPSPSPTTTRPAPAPSCSSPGGGSKPKPKSGSGTGAKRLAVPAGQPMVNKVPSKQISAQLNETGVSFDGVVDLPVQGGTLRALQFSLDSATSIPFELQVPVDGRTLSIKSSKLSVTGNVKFFATRIQGLVGLLPGAGILPVDYTPESPPLLVPKIIFFTKATVQLVFVQADSLAAPNLSISYL